jgi:type I restriction enzyme S subunit
LSKETYNKIADLVNQRKVSEQVEIGKEYTLLGVRWYAKGPFIREVVDTTNSKATRLFPVKVGDFMYNRLFAWKGSFGLISEKEAGCYVSGEFPLFECNPEKLLPPYLFLYMSQSHIWTQIEIESTGSTTISRNRWKESNFLDLEIRIFPVNEQARIVDLISSVDNYIEALQRQLDNAKSSRNAILHELLTLGGDDWTECLVSDLISHSIGGIWGEEASEEEVNVRVVRSTEFTSSGFLNFNTGVTRSVRRSQLLSRELKPGDILLEKSGGGPTQPVGRVVFVDELIPPETVCSNFVLLIRPNQELVNQRFLFNILLLWHLSNRTLEFQAQTTGIRNLRTNDYLDQVVQIPSLSTQDEIVSLIDKFDAQIKNSDKALHRAQSLRSGLLSNLLNGTHEIPASYDNIMGAA